MILKNNSTKGRYYTIIVEGVPRKVFVGAFQEYDLSNLSKDFDDENSTIVNGVPTSHGSRVLMKSNEKNIIKVLRKGYKSNFNEITLEDFITSSKPPKEKYYVVSDIGVLQMLKGGVRQYVILSETYGNLSESILFNSTLKFYINGNLLATYRCSGIAMAKDGISTICYMTTSEEDEDADLTALQIAFQNNNNNMHCTITPSQLFGAPTDGYLISRIDTTSIVENRRNLYISIANVDNIDTSGNSYFEFHSSYGNTFQVTTMPELGDYGTLEEWGLPVVAEDGTLEEGGLPGYYIQYEYEGIYQSGGKGGGYVYNIPADIEFLMNNVAELQLNNSWLVVKAIS